MTTPKAYLLWTGPRREDAGLIYGIFSTDRLASAYAAALCRRDHLPLHKLQIVEAELDPIFHETRPEIIDNRTTTQ
jgi:hypothetical protein